MSPPSGKGRASRISPDLVIAAVLLVLGGAMAVRAIDYSLVGLEGRIGPGFMPFAAGTALAVFAVAIAVEDIRSRTHPHTHEPHGETERLEAEARATITSAHHVQEEPDESPIRHFARGAWAVFLLIALTLWLTTWIGYLPAFAVLLFLLFTVVERERVPLSLAVTVAAVAVAWLVFVRLLSIPLPAGYFQLPLGG